MKEYKIIAAKSQAKDWESKYGPMKTYLIQVEGNGEPVQINKKADSPAPTIGETIYGEVTVSEYGQKFKGAPKPFGNTSKPEYNSDGAKYGNSLKISADFYFNQGTKFASEDEFVGALQELAQKIFSLPIPEVIEAKKTLTEQWNERSNRTDPGPSTHSKDVVAPMPDDDEQINLDDIPF